MIVKMTSLKRNKKDSKFNKYFFPREIANLNTICYHLISRNLANLTKIIEYYRENLEMIEQKSD